MLPWVKRSWKRRWPHCARRLAALQKAEAPNPSLDGERKLVTVMFADISGFTALSEKMDPEAVRDLMNACFERLVPVIEKYDGTMDKFIGDEIMALFGAPVAHENDPERALRAALEMHDRAGSLQRRARTQSGIALRHQHRAGAWPAVSARASGRNTR